MSTLIENLEKTIAYIACIAEEYYGPEAELATDCIDVAKEQAEKLQADLDVLKLEHTIRVCQLCTKFRKVPELVKTIEQLKDDFDQQGM